MVTYENGERLVKWEGNYLHRRVAISIKMEETPMMDFDKIARSLRMPHTVVESLRAADAIDVLQGIVSTQEAVQDELRRKYEALLHDREMDKIV